MYKKQSDYYIQFRYLSPHAFFLCVCIPRLSETYSAISVMYGDIDSVGYMSIYVIQVQLWIFWLTAVNRPSPFAVISF